MYFSNIMDNELLRFHNLKCKSFSISLTQMVSSALFNVETVKQDTLYKIVPLFSVDIINSTNPDDIILDNKVILCKKLSNERFFNFINEAEEDIVDYEEYGDYHIIGEDLTDREFNGIVSLIRHNIVNTEIIQIHDGTIHGEYADYNFDLDNVTVLDNGILLSRETLQNIGAVTLLNPAFINSSYLLQLTVLHITDTNINLEDSSVIDGLIKEEIQVELLDNESVNIPFTISYDYNYILIFDATVTVSHDKPEIVYS